MDDGNGCSDKKTVGSADDAPPAVRNKALENALEHMAKVQETFRGFVWAIEEGELAKQRVAALETLVQQYKDANDKWLKFLTYYLQSQVVKKWLSDNRQTVAIGIVAVVVGVGGLRPCRRCGPGRRRQLTTRRFN